jgi:hypothetical protein
MAILKREFARSAKGPISSNEDWWFLCRNTETGDVFVLHEWAHTDVTKPTGKSDVGNKHIELSVFLLEPRPTSAQAELRKLIGSLVEG